MRLAVSLAAIVASGLLAAGALAQGQAPTTVQLPTFSFFTVNTSVSVPDSGGAYLGGINRARDSSTVRGLLPPNRGLASDRAASGMSVHATIIDLKEMDERILAEAAAMRGPVDLAAAKAELLTRHVGRGEIPVAGPGIASRTPATLTESVAAIRQANTAAAETRNSEAVEFFAKARQAETDNKPAVAKIYYQMVVRRDGGELKQLAQSRLAALDSGKAASIASR